MISFPVDFRYFKHFTHVLTVDSTGMVHFTTARFILSDQDIKTLASAEANALAGTHPDAHSLDLFRAIAASDSPTWIVAIQTMHPSEVSKSPVNIFDTTKVWPKSQYPLRTVGRIVLDKEPIKLLRRNRASRIQPEHDGPWHRTQRRPIVASKDVRIPRRSTVSVGRELSNLPTNATKSYVYCHTQSNGFMIFTDNYGIRIMPVKV